jgi:hypothetical protein
VSPGPDHELARARRRRGVDLRGLGLAGALVAALGCAGRAAGPGGPAAAAGEAPGDDPAAAYGLPWTGELRWRDVVRIDAFPGASDDERVRAAQAALRGRGGGVVFFPAGTYRFADSIALDGGVILRGAPPAEPDARKDGFAPPTRFVFPRYEPRPEGSGTPTRAAFKGVTLADPARASRVGVVHVAIDNGHIAFGEGPAHAAGSGRLVLGCLLRNAARASREIPDVAAGQHAWQRFTDRFAAAIEVHAARDALVARNRLPPSPDGSFLQKGYVLAGKDGPVVPAAGVMFDADNRPGIAVNRYALGGEGGGGADGTPETHPHGFRRGLVIRDNFVYATGRAAIAFSGDGTVCAGNVVRFAKDIPRPTTTGKNVTTGSSTNDNRAVEMRGWRWRVEENVYEVYRNISADGVRPLNDGEGLMHEDHANGTVVSSVLVHNRGNAYISIYKTGGIDGLVVQGNDVRTPGGIGAIFVVSNRNASKHPIRNVSIIDNITGGSGIRVAGEPAESVVVRDNQHVGGSGTLKIEAPGAVVDGNAGYVNDPKEQAP